MPDARCTRDLMRNVHRKCAHEHTGQRRTSDIPCAMALRLITRSPRRAMHCCHRQRQHRGVRTTRLCRTLSRRSLSALPASTATRPTFVNDHDTPLSGTGWRYLCHDFHFWKSEIFLIPRLDNEFRKSELICPSGQFVAYDTLNSLITKPVGGLSRRRNPPFSASTLIHLQSAPLSMRACAISHRWAAAAMCSAVSPAYM